jgi:stress-induced-phosphoprotein 1
MLLTRDAEAWKQVGNDRFRAGNFAEARDAYEHALVNIAQSDLREKCVVLSNLANTEFALGETVRAVERASEAVAADPSWVKAYWRKGQALEKLGEPQLAAFEYLNGLHVIDSFGDNNNQQKVLLANLKRIEGDLAW